MQMGSEGSPPTPQQSPVIAGADNPLPSRRSRLRRRALFVVATLLVLVLSAAAAILWVITGKFVEPIDDTPLNTRIVAASQGTVTLPATPETGLPGTWGLIWQEGEAGERRQGVLGRVLRTDGNTVTRELTTDDGPPPAGAKAKVSVTVWDGDPKRTLALDYQDLTYPGDLGPMPAWFLPGSEKTWIIQIHGLGAGRSAGLRTMPHLKTLGFPVLDITCRNDPGAPHDAHATRRFGDAEWHDLDAAVRYARTRGATGVVLYGFSMGGGIVETYLDRATDTSLVRGVVLDSPALDYRAAISTIVDGFSLPGAVTDVVSAFVEIRSGADLDAVDTLTANRHSGGPKQPVLLFHGTADTIVPHATSAAFAHDWPDDVTLVTVPGASHTGSWNVDPNRYERALTTFLEHHVSQGPPSKPRRRARRDPTRIGARRCLPPRQAEARPGAIALGATRPVSLQAPSASEDAPAFRSRTGIRVPSAIHNRSPLSAGPAGQWQAARPATCRPDAAHWRRSPVSRAPHGSRPPRRPP